MTMTPRRIRSCRSCGRLALHLFGGTASGVLADVRAQVSAPANRADVH